jgi:hypothetical protein
MVGDRVDFFVSHAGADRAWAEWVAWELIEAGYTVELDVWDWAAGRNFMSAISDALDRCDRVVALFSAAYFDRDRYTAEEWSVSVLHVPGMAQGRLVPVRVEAVPAARVPAVLRPMVYRDVFGLAEEQARRVLLEAVTGPRRPDRKPVFPGRGAAGASSMLGGPAPRLPTSKPQVWNVPPRNRGFTGRDGLLVTVRERVLAGDRAVVQALHGLGGVGKTLLAVEFAHRFAGDYDLVWWVNAEQPELVLEQVARLAVAAALVPEDTPVPRAAEIAVAHLRGAERWLLVFDNAEDPAVIGPLLPDGPGHLLITSRNPSWSEVAVPIEVDTFSRTESVHLLTRQSPALTGQDADTIAEQLGDLPLAIAQAAGVLAETKMTAGDYLRALSEETGQVLNAGAPASYPASLAAVVRVTTQKVAAVDVAAAQLLTVCALLAPEPVPAAWFAAAARLNQGGLPDQLAAVASSPFALRQCLALLARHGLARATADGPLLHRLTAAITSDALTPAERAVVRTTAEQLLVSADPAATDDPATWPAWAAILPHLVHLDPAATSNPDLRLLACDATLVLHLRGDYRAAADLAQHLYRAWAARLGEDHPSTLYAANNLARSLYGLGDYKGACALDQETLARRRQVFGVDHPISLGSASNLARDLQALHEYQQARVLQEDTLARRRRILGEDDPATLHSANRLAVILHDLKDYQGARALQEDTLARTQRVLGEDHPETLRSVSDLAATLQTLGDYPGARALQEDTLARRRRVLGDDHPHTLRSASDLAVTLRHLRDYQGARDLQEDTLARRRRVLGDDHPDTLASRSDLALVLAELGETDAARELSERTPGAPMRRVPGDEELANLAGSDSRPPGTLPRVWNVPARNLGFTGRDMVLVKLRERLLAGDRAVVQALHGMGGVGKTQLAIEYAHRYSGSYDTVWWVAAEQPGLILDQIAALGAELRCAESRTLAVPAARAALAGLRAGGRWLLVFDNAEAPGDLASWLPGGSGGHVLITTRTTGWRELAAATVEVDVFTRPESVAILRDRVLGLPEADADQLAEGLGDLPLGIAQAASYLAASGMPPADYLGLVQTRAADILDRGSVMSYPGSLAGATRVTIERLDQQDNGAATVAQVCAFLAPEPVPLALFTTHADQLPEPLAAAAADLLAWRELLAAVARSSLARIDQHAMQMHRLTQAILRDRLGPETAATIRALAGKILATSDPGEPENPTSWPDWAQLLPHILAIDPAMSSDSQVRSLACNASWYLLKRGDTRSGHDLAGHLHQRWKQHLGSDDYHTLWAANSLAVAFEVMGRFAEARDLNEDILARRRRVLGEDHLDTLRSAHNLAIDLRALGDHHAARELDEDTLARSRRVLGENHPDTLNSASYLAIDLRELGEAQAARELDEDTLTRRRRVLGQDHPDALKSANNLAKDLRALGEPQAARDLAEDTLARRRRVLGDNHPSTLNSADNLAISLRALKDHRAARDLAENTLARRRRVLGEDHPDTLNTADGLAADLRALGQDQAARELEEDVASRRRRLHSDR